MRKARTNRRSGVPVGDEVRLLLYGVVVQVGGGRAVAEGGAPGAHRGLSRLDR